ncbi:Flagellar basal-body rod protein FlgG [bioreactor metagenome]|uniref:Flagellar basal-body rod protein FlgG n=1 Tax=bioreactor metagenome TaxID=1076179 RepID=A0A644WMR8_9ZZZZ
MMRSLFSAVSGLKSHQTAMDVIGNNVANVNTTGYKSSRTIFQDIYSQTIRSATAPTSTTGGINAQQVGLGTSISTIGMNMSDGSTQSTSNSLDFAISGDGFFVVSDGNGGYYYSRNGALTTDPDGYLVTANGDYVMVIAENTTDAVADGTSDDATTSVENCDSFATDDLTNIQLMKSFTDSTTGNKVEYTDYAIDSNGLITVTAATTDSTTGETTKAIKTIGRVVLATFNNAGGLEKAGSSYYVQGANSGAPAYDFAGNNCGSLASGSLEMSNVDLATELTNMIITQRGFQANSRVITTSDTFLEELINLKR